ncbi:coadhesin-like [Mercenaria mercenaria]|uniref:coadhesin-like n=1 Tax=Mercenaria mercenaria TaxID=6596 RepID=UPI00234E4611|nr:coadhesin-like [Mercenaria mercenaria]
MGTMAGGSFVAVIYVVLLLHIAEAKHEWGEWSKWSSCDAKCDGSQHRSRDCLDHVGSSITTPVDYGHCANDDHHGTSTFQGTKEIQTRDCSESCTGIHRRFLTSTTYRWDKWTSWTHCNATCDGTTYRLRSCIRHKVNETDHSTDILHCGSHTRGAFQYDRKSCGPACNFWSDWSVWSDCSESCDDGVRYRARHCQNGDACVGDVFQQETCNKGRCLHVVNGAWGGWASWGKCSSSCGLGYNVRFRSCDSPAPQDGGAACSGKHDQVRVCPLVHCPIDGGWGNYTANQCTVTCGVGVLVSTRKCDNPPPQYGGAQCTGSATKFEKCANQLCKIDGIWSEWGNYSNCQVVCGDGYVARARTCTNPPPQNGGAFCSGESTERTECQNGQCPPDIKICDKAQIQRMAAQLSSNTSSVTTGCLNGSLAEPSGFSLLESYCSVPNDRSKWRLGIKIHDNCELIPLYTPVGSSDNGVHVKEAGVMTDCFGDTLQMLSQSCNTNTILKSYNLTDTNASVHMILFEN